MCVCVPAAGKGDWKYYGKTKQQAKKQEQ